MAGLLSESERVLFQDRLLSRLDPRLKLTLLLALVVTVFSASGFGVLFCLVLAAAVLLIWQPVVLKHFLKRLTYLRWLFLFTLLLHLFLTPGRTLCGLRMLSYDGLLRGMMVDLQLLLALFFTLCFALFTEAEAVAWGVQKLLSPLSLLGFPAPASGGLLVLVLHFIPQVFRQGEPLAVKRSGEMRNVFSRLRQLSRFVGDAILVLVEQAEALAQDLHSGKKLLNLKGLYSWKSIDSVSAGLGLLMLAVCWSL